MALSDSERGISSETSKQNEIGPIRRWVNDHFMLVVLAPSLTILYTLVGFPLGYLVDTSLYSQEGLGGELVFSGLANYREVLTDPVFYLALENTIKYTVGVVTLAFLIGLITALAINQLTSSRLRTVVTTAVLLAWAIPSIVTALIWRFMLNSDTGIIYNGLLEWGLINSTFTFTAEPTMAMISIILADAWARSPFATLLLLSGLQTIPDYQYEAARIDGASIFQRFRDITLPHLKPTAGVALLIMTMFAFRTFSIAYGLTGGGPGRATEVLATWIYSTGIGQLRMGYASALSVMMIIFTLILVTAYVKVYQGDAEEGF